VDHRRFSIAVPSGIELVSSDIVVSFHGYAAADVAQR
jgi:hypothetical protein